MWMWIIYAVISLVVVGAIIVAIIFASKNGDCCNDSEGYFDDIEDNRVRKYVGHRYDRDHDRKPTQYSQMT